MAGARDEAGRGARRRWPPPSARRRRENLASSAPATASTGSSPARRPPPARRAGATGRPGCRCPASSRLDASPSAVLRRRSSSNRAQGGRPANSGSASQRSRKASTPSRRSAAARSASADPALRPRPRRPPGPACRRPARGRRRPPGRPGPRAGRAGRPSSSRATPAGASPVASLAASSASPAAVGRSARTSPDPHAPGASSAIVSWSRARSSPTGPQQRPVCVNPWSSTTAGPAPRPSACRPIPPMLPRLGVRAPAFRLVPKAPRFLALLGGRVARIRNKAERRHAR